MLGDKFAKKMAEFAEFGGAKFTEKWSGKKQPLSWEFSGQILLRIDEHF